MASLIPITGAAYGQSDRGTLTGRVADVSGAVIPGASVSATNVGTNVSASTITTDDGLYVIPALQPGTYRGRAEVSGVRTYEQTAVAISAATTVRSDARGKVAPRRATG